MPLEIASSNIIGNTHVLEAIRQVCPEARAVFSGSSEMYGNSTNDSEALICLHSPCAPVNPYGSSKLCNYFLVKQFREFFHLSLSTAVFFNHESELRGRSFVTKKITRNLAQYSIDKSHSFSLGNLNNSRDWSSAKDFVSAVWRLVNSKHIGKDYIFASGSLHTVREFILTTCDSLALSVAFEGVGLDERLVCQRTGHTIISVSPRYFRENDCIGLAGDVVPLLMDLSWNPSFTFESLVNNMIEFDRNQLMNDEVCISPWQ
jgi:GDPmannose 4,6-dehydratase